MNTVGRFLGVGSCVLALVAGPIARANEPAEVEATFLDGATEAGTLVELTGGALKLRTPDDILSVPRADLARLTFFPAASTTQAENEWTVELADTSHFGATLREGAADTLHLRTRFAEHYTVEFQWLTALRRAQEPASPAARELFASARAKPLPGSDVLITLGPEPQAVRGALLELGPERSAFLFNGQRRSLATEKVYGVVMAATSSMASAPARVLLTGGDVLAGTVDALTPQGITLRDGAGLTLHLPRTLLRSVAFSSDRVVYLSDLAPTSFSSAGVVHANGTFRRDRNIANQPLMLRAHRYEKGLGVRARGELVFELSGAYEMFSADVGVDDAVRAGGSVEFRVLTDGKAVFTSGIVRGGDEIQHVRVPLAGVKRLALIVDYADNADVGDWADWANARLIKPRDDSREMY